MLYGRDDELARLTELIDAARDHQRSGSIVLRGEAGIGKSALLEWAAGDEVCRGARVLRVTGFEAERDIAFAGILQLLWPVRDRVESLPEAQAAALRGAFGPTGTGTIVGAAEQDRFICGLAVLTLLADLAEDGPVLCLIDDAQWLDVATTEALLFAARRLAVEGVVMMFAARENGFATPGLPELQLTRLARADAEHLLSERHATLSPSLRSRVVRESDGNPLALLEFGSTRRMPESSAPLPLAERVTASFRAQIAGLPDKTRDMLLIASAEGRGYMPSLLAAAATFGLGLGDLEEAERAGLVEVTGSAIRFRHPLIRSASYHGAVAAQRIRVHRALSEAADDPDCRVRHRATITMSPDEAVAADLEKAAERALSRAGYGPAATLYQHAAELSPSLSERSRRLGRAADAVFRAGRPAEADDFAQRAEKLAESPADLARLARIRAAVEFERGDPPAAARLLIAQAEHAEPGDVPAMLRTGATYAWSAGDAETIGRAVELLRATGHDDPAVRALGHLIKADYAAGLPLLAEQVAAARSEGSDLTQAIYWGLIVGDDRLTQELAVAEAARCRREGLIGVLPNVLQALAQVQIAAGLHRDAEATGQEAITIARDIGMERREGRVGAVLARLAAIEGDEERLHRLVEHAPPPSGGLADVALGLLDLGLGRYEAALVRLEEVAQSPRRFTAGTMVAAADQIEAAVRAGQPERAHEALARFTSWADASHIPWTRAVALRSQALLHEADSSGKAYEEALHLHEEDGARPFERARTELLYGEWLRRARRRSDARGPLRSAAQIFERLKATPWAERARSELRATGETTSTLASHQQATAPDLLDRLTPQELQVVRLAAEGISSREIASQLFLSPRTVEYHLYKAYPKLGISSRKELARLQLQPVP
ncbi:AAA family ATPase [Actinomadura barringtoniae]|uniref:AAA family ATPase n=1 Tax=Actinomadura barringtoniae TaxID=1427535 RepID=A0A939PJW1_9ACTN|nr:LuxR family transcriptional regulator [Actinomadura barringtoniae]MBO2454257.1 AAA family ATPase [Actinomadura barringtoniae]